MNRKNVCNRSYPVLPIAVREEFPVVDATYRSEDYTANLSFSEPNMITYCRIFTTKQNLKERFWDKYPEKLPKDRICREVLIRNRDNLDLSQNAQDAHFKKDKSLYLLQ